MAFPFQAANILNNFPKSVNCGTALKTGYVIMDITDIFTDIPLMQYIAKYHSVVLQD